MRVWVYRAEKLPPKLTTAELFFLAPIMWVFGARWVAMDRPWPGGTMYYGRTRQQAVRRAVKGSRVDTKPPRGEVVEVVV